MWVTVKNIRERRFSRNPKIAKVLYEMWYVRELNEWVKRIYESMEKSFLCEPEYIDKENIVTLVLKNNVSKDEDTISEKTMKRIENIFISLNDSEKQILSYLLINKKSTVLELKENINISIQMIRQYINNFIEIEIVSRDSEKIRDKNAIYKIKK